MTKTHLIKDESLGGVLREYIEVDRKAQVGDYVIITADEMLGENHSGEIHKVIELDANWPDGVNTSGFWNDGSELNPLHDQYKTLEPTDIIHVDGERFRMVDRKAKFGDKVIIVNAKNTYGKYRNGSVIYVEDVTVYGIYNDDVRAGNDNVYGIIGHDEYRVLEPLVTDDVVTAEEGDDKSVIELLANLARRVTSLEQQTEANTKDIAYLDERTRSTNDDSTFTLTQIIEALGGACR